jgi:hypothetical protein
LVCTIFRSCVYLDIARVLAKNKKVRLLDIDLIAC